MGGLFLLVLLEEAGEKKEGRIVRRCEDWGKLLGMFW